MQCESHLIPHISLSQYVLPRKEEHWFDGQCQQLCKAKLRVIKEWDLLVQHYNMYIHMYMHGKGNYVRATYAPCQWQVCRDRGKPQPEEMVAFPEIAPQS